jgi:hypothetical protein
MQLMPMLNQAKSRTTEPDPAQKNIEAKAEAKGTAEEGRGTEFDNLGTIHTYVGFTSTGTSGGTIGGTIGDTILMSIASAIRGGSAIQHQPTSPITAGSNLDIVKPSTIPSKAVATNAGGAALTARKTTSGDKSSGDNSANGTINCWTQWSTDDTGRQNRVGHGLGCRVPTVQHMGRCMARLQYPR